MRDVDLLRNHLLMSLDYENQQRIYNEYLSKIEDNINTENMDKFFVDYLIYIKQSDSLSGTSVKGRQHINEKTLYHAFKNYYGDVISKKKECNTAEVVEYLLKDMYCCSIIYKELIFDSEVRPCKAGEKDPIKIIPWIPGLFIR